jgi:hypothetical protein
MRLRLRLLLLAAAVLVVPPVSRPIPTARADTPGRPPFHELWRADSRGGFDGWSLQGTQIVDGRIVLDPSASGLPPQAGLPSQVEGLSLPSGPAGTVGLALAPIQPTSAQFHELIPSWNAETPPGTWIEVRLRANIGEAGHWTTWYEMGSWASDSGPERRQSVKGQQDADGRVSTDTLLLTPPANAYQLALVLRAGDQATGSPGAADGSSAAVATSLPATSLPATSLPATSFPATALPATPSVSLAAVLASEPSDTAREIPTDHAAWGTTLAVPERSQMVYPNGGPVWCSPTSTSMVMAYWSEKLGEPALDRTVPDVAAAVYDTVYHGNGNWPFNTAFAGQHGLTAYVSRMSSLSQVEQWIAAGIPVVASLAWSPGELGNAAVPSTDGHLLVIVGFTASGDAVVNDPAADPRLGISVRRVYPRGQLERLWLTHSGGTVYLIYPQRATTPPGETAFGAW